MADAQELLIRLDATTESLRRELARASKSVDDFAGNVDRRLGGIDGAFSSLGKGLSGVKSALAPLNAALGTFGLAVGVDAVLDFGKAALQMADDLQDSAAQLGISAEALQVYQYAARQNGIEAEKLQLALQTLNRTIGEAATGSKTAQQKFKGLGIEFQGADGAARGASDVLRDLADLLQALPDPAQRAAAAAELLGAKAGPQLVPLLSDGAAGLDGFAEAAKQAGHVLSDETVKRLADANQAIEDFGTRVTIVTGKALKAILDFTDEASRQGDQMRLGEINNEIRNIQTALAKEARGDFFTGLIGTVETAQARLRELYQQQAALQQALGVGPQAHGSTAKPAPVTVPTISTGDSGGESEAEKKARKLADALKDLQMQVDALTQGPRDTALAKWLDRAGVTGDSDAGKRIAEMVDVLQRADIATQGLAAAQQADAEAGREWAAVQEKGRAVAESVQTPLEAYAARIAELTKLLEAGAISQTTFNRAALEAGETYSDAVEDSKAATLDFKSAAVDGFQSIGTSFEDAALQGQKVRGVLQGLLQDIGRILLRLSVTKPLEGLISSIFSSASLSSSIDNVIAANPEIFAGGGIMTSRGRVPMRKYSGGGVAYGPQLAMFGEGSVPEAYVPVPNGRIPVELSGAAGGVSISQTVILQAQGGSADDNQDLAERTGREARRQLEELVDSRLQTHLRSGGMMNPLVA